MEKTRQTENRLDTALQEVYYDPSQPAGFAGVDALHATIRKKFPHLKRSTVRTWLEKQDVYTLHKPSRRKYPRNRVVVHGIDDLVDLAAYA